LEVGEVHLDHQLLLDLSTLLSEDQKMEDRDKDKGQGLRLDRKKVVKRGLWLFLNSLELLGGGYSFSYLLFLVVPSILGLFPCSL
jgi:hypothetical protein